MNNSPKMRELRLLTSLQLRSELHDLVCQDLLGPAGGPTEEVEESSVRSRYIVGLLAPKGQTLPQDAFSALRQESVVLVQEIRLAAAVKWYEMERISQTKAAEIAGMSRAGFLAALGRYGVTPFQHHAADDLINEVTNG